MEPHYNYNYGVLVFEENGDFFKSYNGGKLINNKFIVTFPMNIIMEIYIQVLVEFLPIWFKW